MTAQEQHLPGDSSTVDASITQDTGTMAKDVQLRSVESLPLDKLQAGAATYPDLPETLSYRQSMVEQGDASDDEGEQGDGKKDASAPTEPPTAEAMLNVMKQIEFYFSDASLPTDKKLLKAIRKDPQGWVPVKMFANFRKVRAITRDPDTISECLKDSKDLVVSEDKKLVRRIVPVPEYDIEAIQKRTVVVENLPAGSTIESVHKLMSKWGNVKLVRICNKETKGKLPLWLTSSLGSVVLSTNASINLTTRNSLGGAQNSIGGAEKPPHAYVEYDTEDEAVLAVAALHDSDGWRPLGINVHHLIYEASDTPQLKPQLSRTASAHLARRNSKETSAGGLHSAMSERPGNWRAPLSHGSASSSWGGAAATRVKSTVGESSFISAGGAPQFSGSPRALRVFSYGGAPAMPTSSASSADRMQPVSEQSVSMNSMSSGASTRRAAYVPPGKRNSVEAASRSAGGSPANPASPIRTDRAVTMGGSPTANNNQSAFHSSLRSDAPEFTYRAPAMTGGQPSPFLSTFANNTVTNNFGNNVRSSTGGRSPLGPREPQKSVPLEGMASGNGKCRMSAAGAAVSSATQQEVMAACLPSHPSAAGADVVAPSSLGLKPIRTAGSDGTDSGANNKQTSTAGSGGRPPASVKSPSLAGRQSAPKFVDLPSHSSTGGRHTDRSTGGGARSRSTAGQLMHQISGAISSKVSQESPIVSFQSISPALKEGGASANPFQSQYVDNVHELISSIITPSGQSTAPDAAAAATAATAAMLSSAQKPTYKAVEEALAALDVASDRKAVAASGVNAAVADVDDDEYARFKAALEQASGVNPASAQAAARMSRALAAATAGAKSAPSTGTSGPSAALRPPKHGNTDQALRSNLSQTSPVAVEGDVASAGGEGDYSDDESGDEANASASSAGGATRRRRRRGSRAGARSRRASQSSAGAATPNAASSLAGAAAVPDAASDVPSSVNAESSADAGVAKAEAVAATAHLRNMPHPAASNGGGKAEGASSAGGVLAKRLSKAEYAAWAAATPEFRAEASAKFGTSPALDTPPKNSPIRGMSPQPDGEKSGAGAGNVIVAHGPDGSKGFAGGRGRGHPLPAPPVK